MLKMPPPIAITEDTPPDMLSGSMDLTVVLPNNKTIRLNIERSTPMLDLLVQVTTSHKMSPGSHYLQPYEENGFPLPYKPSTPIGTLDAVTIHVVPKTGASIHAMAVKKYNGKPFEKTFRLQIHLPHNQLYVMRTNGNTRLSDILHQICETKNLDPSKYSLRHPVNSDKILCLSQTISDTNFQQLSLVPNSAGPLSVSTVDIIGLKSSIDRCDESLSSGSLGGRSLSPTRSDASTESPPLASVMPPSRPGRKRRPAPKPPQLQSQTSVSSSNSDLHQYISHSRNSSDSSGYHEASVLSEGPESNSLPDSLPRRSKLTGHPNNTNLPSKFKMSQSCSNLNSAGTSLSLYKKSNISSSSVSLSSAAGRKKKPAPLPPNLQAKMSALPEEKPQTLKINKVSILGVEEELQLKSATLPCSFPISLPVQSNEPLATPTPDCRSSISFNKVPQPKPRTKLLSESDIPKLKRRAPSPPKRIKLDSLTCETKDLEQTACRQSEDMKEATLACDTDTTAQENAIPDFKLDDEIDRIFHNATKDYETSSLTFTDVNEEPESLQWEYKLPDPPTAFRDTNNPSPCMTEFDTVTICNLTEIVSRDPLENSLVINTENSNGIFAHEETSVKSKNEMIVSVTIENDYKKYKADDEGSDSKQNSMGNDSGLELDDVSSKIYVNNNQNGTLDRFERHKEFNRALENISTTEINNNYKSTNDSEDVDGMTEKWNTNNNQKGNNETNKKIAEEDKDEQKSSVAKEETKITNGFHVFGTKSKLYRNETNIRNHCKGIIPKEHITTKKESSNEPRNNPIVSCVNREHKEGHRDLKRDEDKTKSKVTDTKSAVINELSSFINESKVGVREMANLINDKTSRIPTKPESTANLTSTLSNFKISTYENMKKPISIYCDDSVVNTKPKENIPVPAKPKEEKPKTNIPKINRHNSLSQYDRPDMTSAMKRSSSYISLLSNPVKFNLQKFEKFFSSSCENLEAASNLRRTSSELSIHKENNSIKLRDACKEAPWKRSVQNMSELQSIQVMKSILPRLSVPEEVSLEKENITEQTLSESAEVKQNAVLRKSQSSAEVKEEKILEEEPNQPVDVTRRYSYQGVPDINFTTWSERPKVQVNLKTDRDYKTGSKIKAARNFKSSVNNNFKNVTDVANGVESSTSASNDVEKNEHFPEKMDPRNISMRLASRTKSYARPVSADLSPHAPIVRAVELKKPLSYINSNVPTQPRITRPMSCYLFGENVDYYNTKSHVSTRDMLLASIRSFGKNSLKKVN